MTSLLANPGSPAFGPPHARAWLRVEAAGRFLGECTNNQEFYPDGMRRFQFRLWETSVRCAAPVRACFECGLVWSGLKPEELRSFVTRYGNDEARAKLAPSRKGPPDDELA